MVLAEPLCFIIHGLQSGMYQYRLNVLLLSSDPEFLEQLVDQTLGRGKNWYITELIARILSQDTPELLIYDANHLTILYSWTLSFYTLHQILGTKHLGQQRVKLKICGFLSLSGEI